MELKQIPTDKILANFYQPRTKFEKEGIKELAESILGNGLINPITVRKWKDKFMIVAGERRWRAHKIARLKTIQVFVKEYKSEGQFMIESLIENIHREDLTGQEKGKFADRIMKEEKISDLNQLSRRLSVHKTTLSGWFDEIEVRKKFKSLGPKLNELSSSTIWETKALPKEQREHLLKEAIKEDFGSREMRKRVSEIKSGERPEPIQLERTADEVVDNILSNLHDFKYNVDELLKSNVKDQINIEDLSKSKANKAITTAGLHLKVFKDFVNALRQRGAKPDKLILALIRAKNEKI